jgi:YfiH family protein
MLQVNRISGITLLSEPALSAVPRIVHAFSTRCAEDDRFTLGPVAAVAAQTNRARFFAAAGAAAWPLFPLKQIHSAVVWNVDGNPETAGEIAEGDAAVSAQPGILIGVQTADCVPILIAERRGRAVGVVHAGWRGTASQAATAAVRRMADEFALAPEDLVAVIGPHNSVCCYEVGPDVVESIGDDAVFDRRSSWSKPHLDLGLANKRQLIEAGVPESQITVSSLCTECREDLFFSYRRDGKSAGRMLSIIGIAP